jgi:O-antigen/teichoic acid export membrane protein
LQLSDNLLRRWKGLASRNRGELLFMTGTMLTPAVGMIGGFVTLRHLSPKETGLLNNLSVIPAYLAFLQMGVLSGLSRELPFRRGKGEHERARRLIGTAAATATWIATTGASLCMLAALVHLFRDGHPLEVWGLVAVAVVGFSAPLTTHLETSLRGLQEFNRLGWAVIAANGIALLLNGFVLAWGVAGSLVRLALTAVTGMMTRFRRDLWWWHGRVEWSQALELARTGFPLLISSTLFSLLTVSDRSLVAVFLDKEQAGHFALAGLIVNSMQFIPQSLGLVLFPQVVKHYGATGSSRALRRFVWISLGFNIATIFPVSIAAYWSIGPLIGWLFPKYLAGVPAAKIACLTCLCWVFFGVGAVIGAVNRMKPYLIAMSVSLMVIWGLGWWLIRTGHGIQGAAWARCVGTLGLCAFTIAYSFHLTSVEVGPASRGNAVQ